VIAQRLFGVWVLVTLLVAVFAAIAGNADIYWLWVISIPMLAVFFGGFLCAIMLILGDENFKAIAEWAKKHKWKQWREPLPSLRELEQQALYQWDMEMQEYLRAGKDRRVQR
jgi:hypothetical protein